MAWVDPNCLYRIVSSPRAKATSPAQPAQFLAADSNTNATIPVIMQAAATTEATSGVPSNQLWFFRPAPSKKNPHYGNFTLHNLARGMDVCIERTAANEAKFLPWDKNGKDSQIFYLEGGPPSDPRQPWSQINPPAASLASFTGLFKAVGLQAGPWGPPDEEAVPQVKTIRLDIKQNSTTVGICLVAWSTGQGPTGWEVTTWDVNYVRAIAWNTTRTVPS